MRPATLDRVENGGPGSDINPHERRPKGANSTTGRSSGPRSSSLPPCSKLYKARPGNGGACLDDGATAGLDSLCARRRPKSTVAAEESLRRGRTKEMTQERKKKRLRLWRRLENGRMLRRAEPENVMDCDLPCRSPAREIAAGCMHFPVPVPARCREPGNGNWEVGALAPVLL